MELLSDLTRFGRSGGRRRSHSSSHRAHWLGWLQEYDGKGFYNRKVPKKPRSLAYIYGHIHCAPMLLWLAEVAGVPKAQVREPIAFCAVWLSLVYRTAIRAVECQFARLFRGGMSRLRWTAHLRNGYWRTPARWRQG